MKLNTIQLEDEAITIPVRLSPSHVVTAERIPSLHGALEEWLLDRQAIKNLSPLSITFYRNHTRTLLTLAGPESEVTSISYEQVRRVLADIRARGSKDRTVHADFRAIRAFTRWCARQGWEMDRRLLVMEAPVIADDEEVEIYTADEAALLQKACRDSKRDSLILGLLLGTGVRLAELVTLTLESRQEDRLRVFGKGRKTRYVPLSLRLQRDWVRYEERERPKTAGPLLLGRTGEPLSRHGVQSRLRRLGAGLGVHCYAHKFRHTFATWYVRKSLDEGRYDPETLRKILGHSSYALFPRYLHLAKSDVVKGWERVAPY